MKEISITQIEENIPFVPEDVPEDVLEAEEKAQLIKDFEKGEE